MARNIPMDALIKIAETKGLEPINILRVQWTLGGGHYYYADRELEEIPFIQGKLITLAGLEAVIDVSNTGSSTSVNVEFDDTDGTIKEIFNWNDIHGRPVAILQWFSGLPFGSAFHIFDGSISSPIEWSEGGRVLKFDVMTRIEDVQAGFTIEDGQFLNVPRLLVGKAWPLIFGTVVDMPTLQMDELPSGTLRVDIGIPDENLGRQAAYHHGQGSCMIAKGTCLSGRGAELQFAASHGGGFGFGRRKIEGTSEEIEKRGCELQNQAHKMQMQGQAQILQGRRFDNLRIDQKKYDLKVIPIINGHLFLQNQEICININNALYSGKFQGDNFYVSARQAPTEAIPKEPVAGTIAADTAINTRLQQHLQQAIDRQIAAFNQAANNDFFDCSGPNATETEWTDENYWACNSPWFICFENGKEDGTGVGPHKDREFFHAAAGSSVNVGNRYPIRYVLSIVPGTIVRWLSARKTVNGLKVLTPIPPNHYSLSYMNLGGVIALIATFHQPMSTLKTVNNDLDWDDEIFATLTSPIGPNVVDEMIYIIQRWTTFGIDFASFSYVRAKVDLYPANFALLEKKNVIELLKDMAFQSRCAIWLADGVWHLRYIPEQGTPVDTITENDIESTTLVIGTTQTEDLVTRYIATWRQSYAVKDLNKLILQYNINKYGVHEEEYEYYIYNTEDLVYKSAVFWLIRKANVWKTLKCKTFLTKLKIETLDNVNVNISYNMSHIGNVVGTVTKATFDSAEFSIDMEIWLPVRLGEMYQYQFAYPAGISVYALWPTNEDIAGQFTQASYAPSTATGSLGGSNPNIPKKGSVGTATQARPSDQTEQQSPPPTIVQTIENQAPNYGPATGGAGQTSGAPAPRYDYVNRPAPQIENRPFSAPDSYFPRTMPGYLLERISSTLYTGIVYPDSMARPGLETRINILQIKDDEVIPPYTWGIIHYQPEITEAGETRHVYSYQPPIWHPQRPEDEETGEFDPGEEATGGDSETLFPEAAAASSDTNLTYNPDGGTQIIYPERDS